MSKTKRFKEYLEEDYIKPKRNTKEISRHTYKEHLKHLIEKEDWDELEDETYEFEHSNNRR